LIECIDRFDGKLFFLYDREAVTSEEDPPENAIIYFYPTSVSLIDHTVFHWTFFIQKAALCCKMCWDISSHLNIFILKPHAPFNAVV